MLETTRRLNQTGGQTLGREGTELTDIGADRAKLQGRAPRL